MHERAMHRAMRKKSLTKKSNITTARAPSVMPTLRTKQFSVNRNCGLKGGILNGD
jgi:hypothetical protein